MSQQQQKKNAIARFQFERFSELCGCLPPGEVQIWEGTTYDPPDVCIGDYELGIELVEFIHGSKMVGGSRQKASEQNFDHIVQEAKKRFEENDEHSNSLWVTFNWAMGTRPNRRESEQIVQTLLAIISESLPQEVDGSIEIKWDKFADTCLENYLSYLRITRLKPHSPSTWGNLQAGYPGTGLAAFTDYVREKEKDLPRYRQKFASVWLVIVATGWSISSTVSPDQTVVPACIESQFDRVYFFNMPDKKIIRLTAE